MCVAHTRQVSLTVGRSAGMRRCVVVDGMGLARGSLMPRPSFLDGYQVASDIFELGEDIRGTA